MKTERKSWNKGKWKRMYLLLCNSAGYTWSMKFWLVIWVKIHKHYAHVLVIYMI